MPDTLSDAFRRFIPVCRHFSRLLPCCVCCLRADNSVRCAFVSGRPTSYLDDNSLFGALFGGRTFRGNPDLRLIRPGELYISVDLFQDENFEGRLVAGPVTCSCASPSDGIRQAAGCVSLDFVVSAAALLYYFVYEKWIDTDGLSKAVMSARPSVPETEPEERRPAEAPAHAPHHTVSYENRLFSLITQGNSKSLAKAINELPDGIYGLLDKRHPLRNLKDDCICSLTLATRAAVAGGLDSETAFSLSDDAIQKVELCDGIDGLYRIVEQTLFQLADFVENIRGLNHSYPINCCRNYVIRHVYEKLTIREIANQIGICPEYLSERFKKETGVCLKSFIEQTKTEEAKRLLLSTEKTVLEIAQMLNYHDQSHFIRAFKKETGVTPLKFRKNTHYHQQVF